ncbi:MAG: PAS domain-containing protein [Methylomonas sp.]
MKSKWHGIEQRKSLRAAAESLVTNFLPDPMTTEPAEALLHELLVHKIELEMQNEELRKTHAALEDALEKYVDLYEFAPVGYLTINPEGLISEINLTGAKLLGMARDEPINRRFATFVASRDRDIWHRRFINLMNEGKDEKQVFDLNMTRADGAVVYAHLDCLRRETEHTSPILRVALTNNGDIHPAEKKESTASATVGAADDIPYL